MHARGLLLRILDEGEVIGHRTRCSALLKAVDSLSRGEKLSVTMLGRSWRSRCDEKHRIKSADELLSNRHLHAERLGIYRLLAQRVLLGVDSAVIAVDWSDTGRRDVRVLRATLVLEGRPFVLWEEVYTEHEYNRQDSHEAFLAGLRAVVPLECKVLLLTDAGFRAPWFRQVERYGWKWLGRVRNVSKYQFVSEHSWGNVRDLYACATRRVRKLGTARLNKAQPLTVDLFVSKQPTPKRAGMRRHAEHYRCARSHREPWLLCASPELQLTAKQATELYATRMQIEQSFRDLKNPRHGFGLRYSNSTKPARVAILLLIAQLATFMRWLAGIAATANGWAPSYQANTVKDRRTLSFVFLGGRVLHDPRRTLSTATLLRALNDIRNLVVPVPINA